MVLQCEVIDLLKTHSRTCMQNFTGKKKQQNSNKTSMQCLSQHWQKTRKYVHNWPHTHTHTPNNTQARKKKSSRKNEMRVKHSADESMRMHTHTHTHTQIRQQQRQYREHMQMILPVCYKICGRNFGTADSSSVGMLDATSWLP